MTTADQNIIGRCCVCEETVTLLDVEHGNAAEMYDPTGQQEGGVCHAECGIANGLEVA